MREKHWLLGDAEELSDHCTDAFVVQCVVCVCVFCTNGDGNDGGASGCSTPQRMSITCNICGLDLYTRTHICIQKNHLHSDEVAFFPLHANIRYATNTTSECWLGVGRHMRKRRVEL